MKIAEVGNLIEYTRNENGKPAILLQGTVLKIQERSVIVDQTVNSNWKQLGLEDKTVVGHSRYTIIDDSALEISDGSSVVPAKKVNKEIEIDPGSLENYHYLRELGYTDSSIRKFWQDKDTNVNWHNSRFYKFKQDNNLVNTVKKADEPKPIESMTTATDDVTVQSEPQTDVEMLREVWPDHPLFTSEVEVPRELVEELKNAPITALAPASVEILPDEKLLAEIRQLQSEVRTLNNELWSERTARLFDKQTQMDALICESNSLQIADYTTDHVLATIVELAEVAQEEQSFKYWKKNKPIDREKLLEETVDVLHFVLSIGVQLGFKRVAYSDDVQRGQTVSEHMLIIVEVLLKLHKADAPAENYIAFFNVFRVFVEVLGFNWLELSAAYDVKFNENISRQNRNY